MGFSREKNRVRKREGSLEGEKRERGEKGNVDFIFSVDKIIFLGRTKTTSFWKVDW